MRINRQQSRAPAQALGDARGTAVDLVQVPVQDGKSAAGLGNRVEGILKLAEQQAADHRQEAEREAAAVIAEAREEAARIREGQLESGG